MCSSASRLRRRAAAHDNVAESVARQRGRTLPSDTTAAVHANLVAVPAAAGHGARVRAEYSAAERAQRASGPAFGRLAGQTSLCRATAALRPRRSAVLRRQLGRRERKLLATAAYAARTTGQRCVLMQCALNVRGWKRQRVTLYRL